jgi:hypothetical protein
MRGFRVSSASIASVFSSDIRTSEKTVRSFFLILYDEDEILAQFFLVILLFKGCSPTLQEDVKLELHISSSSRSLDELT